MHDKKLMDAAQAALDAMRGNDADGLVLAALQSALDDARARAAAPTCHGYDLAEVKSNFFDPDYHDQDATFPADDEIREWMAEREQDYCLNEAVDNLRHDLLLESAQDLVEETTAANA